MNACSGNSSTGAVRRVPTSGLSGSLVRSRSLGRDREASLQSALDPHVGATSATGCSCPSSGSDRRALRSSMLPWNSPHRPTKPDQASPATRSGGEARSGRRRGRASLTGEGCRGPWSCQKSKNRRCVSAGGPGPYRLPSCLWTDIGRGCPAEVPRLDSASNEQGDDPRREGYRRTPCSWTANAARFTEA